MNITSENLFNKQLKKYRKRYSVTKDDCDMYRILGKIGQIEPYSLKNQSILSCWCYNINDIVKGLKKRKCGAIVRAVSKFATRIRHMDGEVDFLFDVKYLDDVAKIIKSKRKRQLSSQQKIEQAVRARLARNKIKRPLKINKQSKLDPFNDNKFNENKVSNG